MPIDNPNLTADQWDLYVGDPKTKMRVDRAAVRLNEQFTESVNAGMDRDRSWPQPSAGSRLPLFEGPASGAFRDACSRPSLRQA